MAKTSERHTEAMIRAYDFGGIKTLVDVGGGFGGTLAAILAAFPALQGVVFDLPAVADAAAAALAAAGLAGRCRAEGGDMRRAVPRGGDAYLRRHLAQRCVLRHLPGTPGRSRIWRPPQRRALHQRTAASASTVTGARRPRRSISTRSCLERGPGGKPGLERESAAGMTADAAHLGRR